MKKRTDQERFEAKFAIDPDSGCWLWTASLMENGYGQFALGRVKHAPHRVKRAHRVSWELYRGPIPDGLHVLHRCDVRACVNPNHLFLGTNADNQADMDHKGRRSEPPHAIGEDNNLAKLTEVDVRAIRASGGSCRAVAASYGLSPTTVSHIRRRITWSHLD